MSCNTNLEICSVIIEKHTVYRLFIEDMRAIMIVHSRLCKMCGLGGKHLIIG